MKKFIAPLALTLSFGALTVLHAQSKPATAQKIDAEYTAKIKESLQDPRITTELVDHLPAPTPCRRR